MLTNDVQIAYSQTEGYVPVTSKAHKSDEYKDYLSRKGEDNDLYYDIKLEAAQLLLDNVENTFVTPVFNGSASLRNAAGQLIEDTTKSVRRKETIDESYFDRLYDNINSLYRLDQKGGSAAAGKTEFGALPITSVVLISALCIAWVLIIAYVVKEKLKNQKK